MICIGIPGGLSYGHVCSCSIYILGISSSPNMAIMINLKRTSSLDPFLTCSFAFVRASDVSSAHSEPAVSSRWRNGDFQPSCHLLPLLLWNTTTSSCYAQRHCRCCDYIFYHYCVISQTVIPQSVANCSRRHSSSNYFSAYTRLSLRAWNVWKSIAFYSYQRTIEIHRPYCYRIRNNSNLCRPIRLNILKSNATLLRHASIRSARR